MSLRNQSCRINLMAETRTVDFMPFHLPASRRKGAWPVGPDPNPTDTSPLVQKFSMAT